MSDIVETLRDGCDCGSAKAECPAKEACQDAFDAADEIERLREALQQCLHVVQAEIDCCKNDTAAWYRLCFATLDKARAALGEKE